MGLVCIPVSVGYTSAMAWIKAFGGFSDGVKFMAELMVANLERLAMLKDQTAQVRTFTEQLQELPRRPGAEAQIL